MAVALLDTPVIFHCMDKPEEGLPVQIVFLLANRKPDEQVKSLRSIMSLFEDGANLKDLHEMPDAALVSAFLRERMSRAIV
jgi:mannitol/fructose-specific phosphotransferase system IIA component (Ntr-type)